jgi:hypothetical protein
LSLGISPPLIEISALPPADINTDITLENKTEDEVKLRVMIKPFRLNTDGTGSIDFLPSNTFQGKDPAFFDKVRILDQGNEAKEITLGPFESRLLNLSIKIDEQSPLSDYYFSVLFISNVGNVSKSSTLMSGGIGTNVILSIGDKGKPSASISKFEAPGVVIGNKVAFSLSLRNNGERMFVANGKIQITDMFGRNAGEVKIPPLHVLANSERHLNNPQKSPSIIWDGNLLFGLYTAKATILLDESSGSVEKTTTFIAMPLYLVLGITFLSFVGISIYLQVKKKVK